MPDGHLRSVCRPPSSVVVRRPQSSNIFSETTKFTYSLCSNWSHDQGGHYANILVNIHLRTDRSMSLKRGIQHRALECYQICSNNDPKLTFDFFSTRVSFGSFCIYMGKRLNGGLFRNYRSSLPARWSYPPPPQGIFLTYPILKNYPCRIENKMFSPH